VHGVVFTFLNTIATTKPPDTPWGVPTDPARFGVWHAAATGELVAGVGAGIGEWLTDGRRVMVTVLTGWAAVGGVEHAQLSKPITARVPIRSGFIVDGSLRLGSPAVVGVAASPSADTSTGGTEAAL
jgi:hypothetical protein